MPTCFEFWYYMYGDNIGELQVLLEKGGPTNTEVLWRLTGHQGWDWRKALVPIRPNTGSFSVSTDMFTLTLFGLGFLPT